MTQNNGKRYIIRKLEEQLDKENINYRQHCGLIIAAAFSMMILLLSFVKERNILLDVGILFLLLSILFQYELYRKSQFIAIVNLDLKTYFNDYCNIVRKYAFYDFFGYFTFFVGITFIFVFFHLLLFAYLLLAYLHYRWIKSIVSELKDKKDLDKSPIKRGEIDFTPDLKTTTKYIIIYSLVIGIIIIVITIMFLFNLF